MDTNIEESGSLRSLRPSSDGHSNPSDGETQQVLQNANNLDLEQARTARNWAFAGFSGCLVLTILSFALGSHYFIQKAISAFPLVMICGLSSLLTIGSSVYFVSKNNNFNKNKSKNNQNCALEAQDISASLVIGRDDTSRRNSIDGGECEVDADPDQCNEISDDEKTGLKIANEIVSEVVRNAIDEAEDKEMLKGIEENIKRIILKDLQENFDDDTTDLSRLNDIELVQRYVQSYPDWDLKIIKEVINEIKEKEEEEVKPQPQPEISSQLGPQTFSAPQKYEAEDSYVEILSQPTQLNSRNILGQSARE